MQEEMHSFSELWGAEGYCLMYIYTIHPVALCYTWKPFYVNNPYHSLCVYMQARRSPKSLSIGGFFLCSFLYSVLCSIQAS